MLTQSSEARRSAPTDSSIRVFKQRGEGVDRLSLGASGDASDGLCAHSGDAILEERLEAGRFFCLGLLCERPCAGGAPRVSLVSEALPKLCAQTRIFKLNQRLVEGRA